MTVKTVLRAPILVETALLSLSDQRSRSCHAVDAIPREHLAGVDRKIADLAALRRELDSIISQCGHGTVNECRIIEVLAPNPRDMHA